MAIFAKKTGMIILGGGLVKHHIANANLMVNNLSVIFFANLFVQKNILLLIKLIRSSALEAL